MYDKSKEGKIIENIEYSNPPSVLNKYMSDKKCLWKLQPLVWISERKTRPHKTYMHLSVFHLIQPKSFSELLAWGGTRYILFVSKDDQWYPAEVVLFQDTWGQIITGLGELCFVIAIHNKKYSCKQSYEIIMTHYLLHYLYLKIQFDIKRLWRKIFLYFRHGRMFTSPDKHLSHPLLSWFKQYFLFLKLYFELVYIASNRLIRWFGLSPEGKGTWCFHNGRILSPPPKSHIENVTPALLSIVSTLKLTVGITKSSCLPSLSL